MNRSLACLVITALFISYTSAAERTVGPGGFKTIGEGVAALKAGDAELEDVSLTSVSDTLTVPCQSAS
jgi:hypothetical protein